MPPETLGELLGAYAGRELGSFWPELAYLRNEVDELIEKGSLRSEAAIQEYIGAHAGASFRRRWEYCTRQERLMLYQLARGWYINVRSEQVLERLIRRGFVVLDPDPRLVNDALRAFVIEAEPPGRFEAWLSEASEGIWQSIRWPFFIVMMLLIAWLAYSAGELFQSLAAVAASTLAFVGTLLRAAGVARGTNPEN